MCRNQFALSILAVGALTLAGCSKPTPPPVAEKPPMAEEAKPAAPAVPAPTHALTGEVVEVGPGGSHVVVKTADGKKHRVETSADTTVRSLKDGAVEVGKGAEQIAKITAEDVKKGTTVAVQYTEKEGKLIAHEVQHTSKATVKKSVAVIHKVEEGGGKIITKAADGTEEVYEVTKHATVAAGDKIVDFGKLAGEKFVQGTQATIHFTEQSGKKMVHFVEQK